ncbi:MAG: TlyA family RNA methyltransferase, partial [Promethearchaeota archaeon]
MKERLDILLVERRLTESRTKAHWLIRNGYVYVNDVQIKKPGKKVDNSKKIFLKKKFPYVGRGGLKLEAALKKFSISAKDKICIDIGASIGGFTDCLLKQGASKVYTVDTAKDLLHPSLRCEKMKEKVIPLLGIDARYLKELTEKVDICTIDVTFTSIRSILPNVKYYLKKDGNIIVLIKPLFESEFHDVKKFKIISNFEELQRILIEIIEWSIQNN